MPAMLEISNLAKTYADGFEALKGVSLTIEQGEIFALLGPNGAGKTTLINIICGIVNKTSGTAAVAGFDIDRDVRSARARIGLVPQEMPVDLFEPVFDTVSFSRGLYGKSKDPAVIERALRSLSLWDKRSSKIMELSGGMKRRVLIAKALSHEPELLFLDEPTAGVDVELRQDMWNVVRRLRESGVTIVLTTHYIEEAEEMADRVGVINHGELIVVEDKRKLMRELGKKELVLDLEVAIKDASLLDAFPVEISESGKQLKYVFDTRVSENGVSKLLHQLHTAGLRVADVQTFQSSLEDIFVDLVKRR